MGLPSGYVRGALWILACCVLLDLICNAVAMANPHSRSTLIAASM
jgi:hypothetical protein